MMSKLRENDYFWFITSGKNLPHKKQKVHICPPQRFEIEQEGMYLSGKDNQGFLYTAETQPNPKLCTRHVAMTS